MGPVATVLWLTLAAAPPAMASAAPDLVQRDARRDAHPALDVVDVTVSRRAESVKVVVRVRDYVSMEPAARVPTAVGVHFDTSHDRRPEHLMQIRDGTVFAGSTWEWNVPNPLAPEGDWRDCVPDDWGKPLVRPRPAASSIVFNAPLGCLEDPEDVRVAVQSHRPVGSAVEPDWLVATRRYTPWVPLAD